jgi:hypothetical protein
VQKSSQGTPSISKSCLPPKTLARHPRMKPSKTDEMGTSPGKASRKNQSHGNGHQKRLRLILEVLFRVVTQSCATSGTCCERRCGYKTHLSQPPRNSIRLSAMSVGEDATDARFGGFAIGNYAKSLRQIALRQHGITTPPTLSCLSSWRLHVDDNIITNNPGHATPTPQRSWLHTSFPVSISFCHNISFLTSPYTSRLLHSLVEANAR